MNIKLGHAGLFLVTTCISITAHAANSSNNGLNERVNQLEIETSALAGDIDALKNQVNENTLRLDDVTPNAADQEPPQIFIDASATAGGGTEQVTTTFSDNEGLFKYSVRQRSENVSYEAETSIVVERSVIPAFGQDTLLTAYATDRSGNATTATHIIQSTTGITPGVYLIDVPLNETISGSGCQLRYHDVVTLEATSIRVEGAFLRTNETCDYRANEDPENTVACISVSLSGGAYSPLRGYAKGAITSAEDTVFSADSLNTSGSGSGGISYKSYTQMTAEFYDTTPATVSIDMTLRCESATYGTETFGPYQMSGTLQQ